MSGVKQTGGVAFGGGAKHGLPSPAGTWSSAHSPNTVDFDRDAFTRLLADKGYDVTWQKATLCPNRPSGGLRPKDHDIACTLCDNGLGFLYYTEERTRMLITGVRLDQSYYAYGRWDVGQVMVTALPEFRIHYWDRLTLHNSVARFHELVRRQPGTTFDSLKYAPLCIDHISWVDRAGALRVFTVDQDFQINDGKLEWIIATGLPDDGSYYSVSYEYRPRYIVLDLMHQHRDSTVEGKHYEFPVQAVAKLDFLIRDESKDNPDVVDQDPFPRG